MRINIFYLIKNILLYLKKSPAIIKRDVLKTPIINYFNTDFKKDMLLSYITKPFRLGIDFTHTNMIEAPAIAEIFKDLGYNIDIVDYDYEGYVDQKKYKLLFGFGEPFVKNFYGRNLKVISIYYATGMSIEKQNRNSLKRVEDFYKRTGIYLPSSARIYEKSWNIQSLFPDAIISLGNDTARKSFEEITDKKIYALNPSFLRMYDYEEIINKRNFKLAKKNFLWFASSGMIHKGLDLLIEVFKELEYLHIHICAPLDNEPEFRDVYSSELSNLPNVHYYGFISLKSPVFKELMIKCAAVVYPSCSEGGSPAVLNVCGNGGIIPILSKESTLDIEGYGYILEDLKTETIKDAIKRFAGMDDLELKEKALITGITVSKNYSLLNFTGNIKNIIEEILKDTKS
jgi:glycosyltransferase involved in cell wall biosynthesis